MDSTKNIFDRDDSSSSCPFRSYSQCDIQSSDAICCPEDTYCMVLASNTTVICCPESSGCSLIVAITCDITQQDSSKHPTSPVQTIALDKSLEKCGDKCCPFGYLCNGSGQCKLDPNQDHYQYLLSDSSTTSLSPTDIPSSTSSAIATSTSDLASTTELSIPTLVPSTKATSTADTKSSTDNSDDSSPTGLIAACSIGGVCCAAAVGILIWLQWFRKQRAAQNHWATPSQSSDAYFDTPRSTRYLLARGPDDKFRITPSTVSLDTPSVAKTRCSDSSFSPIELPATPVSMSCWIEGAEVEEPRLAYVLPVRKLA
ncbi:hypothetical protein BGZ63DRAFT_385815 [Mariannaea sp. PMI_226]|nr:hypothetical protein BGZ63DRAFT_385815 [Mariannaea sp. PMI_226]